MNFEYGVDQQRIKMNISVGYPISVCTNYYVNSANMEILNGESYTYIYADGKPIAIHKQSDNKLYYLHLDHQGSLLTITDNNGIVGQRSYDAWGHNPANWSCTLSNPFGINSISLNGYTMHEHLDAFNLINMNGRLYDPVLCRMLSSDQYALSYENTQSYNRYSYCLNNSLKFTDPSGSDVCKSFLLCITSLGFYFNSFYFNCKYGSGNKWGNIKLSFKQYNTIQADFTRARFYGEEYCGVLYDDGLIKRASASSGARHGKNYTKPPNTKATYHIHRDEPEIDITEAPKNNFIGNVPRIVSTQYHSPNDLLNLKLPSLVLNRFDASHKPVDGAFCTFAPSIMYSNFNLF
ncbi:MAG: hypothetical protein H7296_06740 [Bacteroidia bacterium]|nr:hypothetical protein [Bacteroidia bacterium]